MMGVLTPTLAIFHLYRGVNKNCIYRKTPARPLEIKRTSL
jgi:hypothetical protein